MRHAPLAVITFLLAACHASTGPASPPRDEPPPTPAADPAADPAPGAEPTPAADATAAAVARSLVTAPVPSACGTPVVDGVLAPGEWDGAVSARFGAKIPESAGGGEIPATLQAMSDDVNLYVAIRSTSPRPSSASRSRWSSTRTATA
jgi:hypothetical protein